MKIDALRQAVAARLKPNSRPRRRSIRKITAALNFPFKFICANPRHLRLKKSAFFCLAALVPGRCSHATSEGGSAKAGVYPWLNLHRFKFPQKQILPNEPIVQNT
jgi:hypothetical protein